MQTYTVTTSQVEQPRTSDENDLSCQMVASTSNLARRLLRGRRLGTTATALVAVEGKIWILRYCRLLLLQNNTHTSRKLKAFQED
jgi:hypothetical protein